jgi:hypothetical protein
VPDEANRAKLVAAGACEAVVAALRTAHVHGYACSPERAGSATRILLDIVQHLPHTAPVLVEAGARVAAAMVIMEHHQDDILRPLSMELMQALE